MAAELQELIPSVPTLDELAAADERLTRRYAARLEVNRALDRTLVSFQGNKSEAGSRWFKYREGFSAALVHYLLRELGVRRGVLLDPFAGSGTALFAASDRGLDATGIELLPSSVEAIQARQLLRTADPARMASSIREFSAARAWERDGDAAPFPHLQITAGAFPPETERLLGRYLEEASALEDPDLGRVLRFAALCILEGISYTRKDGQYLRWDPRSGRPAGRKPFDKGPVLPFTEAITRMLEGIAADLGAAASPSGTVPGEAVPPLHRGEIHLLSGSCHALLPALPGHAYDALVTSPPYCNRYDYTRTYALELAMMGVGEEEVRELRQTLLSCTVENREKHGLASAYSPSTYRRAWEAFRSQEVLQLLLSHLEGCRVDRTLNNTGIPRMVRNYFWEMALVITEAARLLRPGAPFVMVNDNVRYMGARVPVDLILSDFATHAGFQVETIWVLPKGKGNSSQQMGAHGREEVRKCVYVWRAPAPASG
jgi:DNA modification methylase